MSTYDNNTDRTAYMTLGLLFGTAAGIGIGMLLAPRSGEQTRLMLRSRAANAKQQAQDRLIANRNAAVQKLSDGLDASKGVVDTVADKAKTTVGRTATRAKDAADKARSETDRTA